jgi:hypothetical protein
MFSRVQPLLTASGQFELALCQFSFFQEKIARFFFNF